MRKLCQLSSPDRGPSPIIRDHKVRKVSMEQITQERRERVTSEHTRKPGTASADGRHRVVTGQTRCGKSIIASHGADQAINRRNDSWL